VAQSKGSIEPRCGRPTTSPWPVGHVLAHFQKPFCLCVQQRRCSMYPMPKGGSRRKLGRQPNCNAGRPDKWDSRTQSSVRAPPYSTYKYHGAPLAESVKKVRFSPLPQGASKFNLCRVERERGEVLRAGGLSVLSGVLRVARARKLCRNPFRFDGVFQALVRSSAGALPKFYEFWQRADSRVPLVY
jgi:hypothetical protein